MASQLGPWLASEAGPGLYSADAADVRRMQDAARARGFELYHVNASDLSDAISLIRRCADVMRFPDYWQLNWNSFRDIITDFDWDERVTSKGHLLLLEGLEPFAKAEPKNRDVLLDILASASEWWKTHGKAFYTLIQGPAGEGLPRLRP